MNRSQEPEASGLFDGLFDLLGRIVDDVRQRVVEEGWFGRPVTGDGPKMADKLGWDMPRPTFEESWAPAERTQAQEPSAPEHDGPGLDL